MNIRLKAWIVVAVVVTDGGSSVATAQAKMACTAQLRDFVTTEASYSGYTRLELIRQMRTIRRNGFDVHDAEQILGVAEDVARGDRLSLPYVVRAILRTVDPGETSGVVAIDPQTARIVRRHGHLSELLTTLARDFKNSIHDHDPEVAAGRLAVRMESNDYLSEVNAVCEMPATSSHPPSAPFVIAWPFA